MNAPPGHPCTTATERALCDEMRRVSLAHEHRSLRYRVHLSSGDVVEYRPGLVVRRGGILFLLETADSAEAGARISATLAPFLEQHSPEVILVLLVPPALVGSFSRAAYDEIYADTDVSAVVRRIREQPADGFVEPFRKPGSP